MLLWDAVVTLEDGPSVVLVIKCVDLMVDLIKGKEMKNSRLVLPWRPLYDTLNHWCFQKWKTPDFNGPKAVPQRNLIHLVRKCNKFFPPESTAEIISEFFPKMCIHDNLIFKAQSLFTLFLNIKTDESAWFGQSLAIWEWVPYCQPWSCNWLHLFSSLAKSRCGNISLEFESNLKFFFTQFVQFTGLSVGSSSLVKIKNPSFPSDCHIFLPHHHTSSAYSYMAKLIIYTMTSTNDVLLLLGNFLEQIKSYFHPSNDGSWSMHLGTFVEMLATYYIKRMKKEQSKDLSSFGKLNSETHEKFISILLPVCEMTVYSKKFMVSKLGVYTLAKLCRIHPDSVYRNVIERIIFIMSSPTAARQISSAIDASASLVPPAIHSHSFSATLPQLIHDTLPAIDLNDVQKTYGALKFYYGLLSYTPVFQGSGTGIAGKLDSEISEFRKIVVESYSEWAYLFLEKILEFLSHREEKKVGGNGIAMLFGAIFKRTITLFFMQLSNPIHNQLLEKLVTHVKKNIVLNSKTEYGHLCSAATRAAPAISLKHFFSLCDGFVSSKTHLVKREDNKIIWILFLVGKVVRFGGKFLLPYREKIISLISATNSDITKKKLATISHKLLRNTLKSLTQIYPLDYRSLPPKEWNSESLAQNHWQQWDVPTTLDIQWHIPSAEEVQFAKELINKFGGEALDALDSFSHKSSDKPITDKHVTLHLSTLRSIMIGAGMILPEQFTNDDNEFLAQMREINEENGFVEFKTTRLSTGIPPEFLFLEFRSRVCNVAHLVALRYLEEQSHFIPTIASVVKLLVVLLSVRETTPQKYKTIQAGYGLFKKHFADPFRPQQKYPRAIQVEKQYKKFMMRLDNSLFGLPFHKQTKFLFQDILQLYTTHFEPLKGVRDSILGCFHQVPLAQGYFLPSLIQKLETKDLPEPEINAVVSLLSAPSTLRKIVRKWKLLNLFIRCLSRAHVQEKREIQGKIYGLFSQFVQFYFTEPIKSSLPNLEKIPTCVPRAALEKARDTVQHNNELNEQTYFNILEFLVKELDSPEPLHWRYLLMALASLLMMLRSVKNGAMSIRILKTGIKTLENADLPIIRTLSMQLIQSILTQEKYYIGPKKPNVVIHERRTKESILSEQQPNEHNWDKFPFLDKVYLGWNGPITITPAPPSKGLGPEHHEELKSLLLEKFLNPNFMKKIFEKMEQDHNISTDEDKDREERIKLGKFIQFAASMDINVEAIMGQFGGANENKDVISSLVGSNRVWPSIRTASSQEKLGKGFSLFNAAFWKIVLLYTGSRVIETSTPKIIELATSDERGSLCVAAEFVAGAIRATKYFPYQMHKISVGYLSKILEIVRDHSYSRDAALDWSSAIRWATTDQDPRRLRWMTDVLFSAPISPNKTSQAQLQQLLLLESVIQEFSWRGVSLADKLLSSLCHDPPQALPQGLPQGLSQGLSHPYKQVREGIADLLYLIFSISTQPPRDFGLPVLWKGTQVDIDYKDFVGHVSSKLAQYQGQKEDTAEQYRETVLQWLSFSTEDPKSIVPLIERLLPTVFQMQTDCAEDTRNLSKVVIALISQLYFPPDQLESLIQNTLLPISKASNWRVRSPLSPFLQIFVFNHSFLLSPSSLSAVFSLVITLLGDVQIEVCEAAKRALSSLIRVTGTHTIQNLIEKFTKLAKTKIPKKILKVEDDQALVARQHGLLGLAALVESQPYDVPQWLPAVVTAVSEHLRDPHPIKKIAGDCIKEFWRTHQDEWVFVKEKFTTEQIESIMDSTGPSYFA